MADQERPWWELYGALFGGTLSPERCQAWSEIWAAKGYQNREMTAAVLALAKEFPGARPKWPGEHLDWLESWMFKSAIGLLLAGKIPPQRIPLMLPDLKAWTESARKASAKAGSEFPEMTRPETEAYREAQTALQRAKAIVIHLKGLEAKTETPLPQLRGV